MSKITYVDNRPLWFPSLTYYPSGRAVNKGDVIEVSDGEKINLLNRKNGDDACFKIEQSRPKRTIEQEEQED